MNWKGIFRSLAWVFLGAIFIFIVLITIEIVAAPAVSTLENHSKGIQNQPSEAIIERGAYLAKLGNCAACHTARGGEPFAGGQAIHTPFGAVFASNITPHETRGIGRYTSDAFYRAMNRGIAQDGRLLTPAFPYPNFTLVSRADSDALYAFFMHGVKAVDEKNRAHELPFPLNTQLAIAAWRVLFFKQGATENIASPAVSMGENDSKALENQPFLRGQYLVQGLGHCSACHASRNWLGASSGLLSGSLMPQQDWYAPSLHDVSEAGVQEWPRAEIIRLLGSGSSAAMNASVLGPMAEVVAKSTQFWKPEDLEAAAIYLQSLPIHHQEADYNKRYELDVARQLSTYRVSRDRGAHLYQKHCATCHGIDGQGLRFEDQNNSIVAIPALAGNRAVQMKSSANLIRILLAGGYAPSTPGNPTPFGMPPFVHVLSDEDIAHLATYIRISWGNFAEAVSPASVIVQRRGVLQ